MYHARIAIVGGGLAGLYAAWLLEQQGLGDCVLFEAREKLGGRILSVPVPANDEAMPNANERDRFDLGPTWFWPDIQPQLDRLLVDLELERFAQHEAGDAMVERSRSEPPIRVRGYTNAPASMRLAGGMEALIDALLHRLTGSRILTGHTVRRLRRSGAHVEIDIETTAGQAATWRAEHVLLAAPPRLIERSIAFIPALPEAVTEQWCATPTWMAPHAKYVAIYEKPFWRDFGLSGEARSACGPMAEIHDASMPGASAALFGFIGIPAQVRASLTEDALRAHCRDQLVRLFGAQAAAPKAEFIKDWAADPHTATTADLIGVHDHAAAPVTTVAAGSWLNRLTGISSEWSPQFPGYLAGALEAARIGVDALQDRLLP